MPVSFAFACANPLHSIIDREEEEKCPFLLLCGFTRDSVRSQDRLITLKTITLRFQSYLTRFKLKDSELNTSTINAIAKSSMKPWSGATANCHLCGSGEGNQEQRRTNVSFGRTMMQVLELQWLAKRHMLGRSDIEQWRNRAHSPSGYWVTLVWRHQIVR